MNDTQPGSVRRGAVTAGVMVGMFLAALEATVIGTAMPTVITALGGLEHYSWVFSGYLLTSTVTVPLWGKLSDLYGRGPIYQLGIGMFLLGSALSGAAMSMGQLIAFRAIQGIGAGALVPLAMTIIGDLYTPQERAHMQGWFSAVWGTASVIGPLAGGYITDALSWRWVFFINLPIGIVAAVVVGLTLPPPARKTVEIDYAGAAFLTAACTLLLVAVGQGIGVDTPLARIGVLALAGVLFAIFLRIEAKAHDPLIPLDLWSNRVVSASVAAGGLIGVGMFGVITYVPLFAQGVQGVDATRAGSLLTPLMVSWVLMSMVGGRALLKIGYRATAVAGILVQLVGFMFLARVSAATTRGELQAAMVLVGAGLGLTMLTLLIAVQHAVPAARRGVATSLNQFARSVGGAVGVAVLGALLSAATGVALGSGEGAPARHATHEAGGLAALMNPATRAALPPAERHELESRLAGALARVFLAAGLATLGALALALMIPREAGVVGAAENPADGPPEPALDMH